METRECPICKRQVSIVPDGARGTLATHGPGPEGEFVCPGSSDKSMVLAAAHLHVDERRLLDPE